MKVVKLETFPVRVAYKHVEASSLINRGGITDVLVKLTADNGLVGWGECTRAADTAGIESAVRNMAPLVIGRDPWDKEAIHRDLGIYAVWAFQPMTGNFAFAGIDMALWDLCGKECGQPLYRMLGGAMREEVDYFYYMEWGTPAEIERQAQGRRQARLSRLLHQGRRRRAQGRGDARGLARRPSGRTARSGSTSTRPGRFRRRRVSSRAGTRNTISISSRRRCASIRSRTCSICARRVDVAFCVNEGLWREADAYRIIKSRCGDYLCFSQYWVGSLGRWHVAQPDEPPGRLAGDEAHAWRIGAHRGGRPACHARRTQCRTRQPADRADDGGRHPHRAPADRRWAKLGPHRQARSWRRRR